MKLSIIICVYNTAINYLVECLESITNSTLKDISGDYEICMVDDGSTLDYSDLISKYPIKYLKTQNRGILSARTTGAKMACGEYSVFCDSDDTVSFNYHLPMLEKAISAKADIVINGWASNTARARYYAEKDDTMYKNIDVCGEDTLLTFSENEGRQHSFFVLWNKLYKTKLLQNAIDSVYAAGISERTSYSEDVAINFFAWRDAKRIVNIRTGFYFYRIHSTQSVNVASAKKLKSQIDNMTKTLLVMRDNIGDTVHKDKILEHINEWAALMARAHYSQAESAKYTELFPYIKEKYDVEKLSFSTVRDGSIYEHKKLLGDNFEEIDSLLLQIHDSDSKVRVRSLSKDRYIIDSINYIKNKGKITEDSTAPIIVIPKFKISLRQKLIHNAFLYRLGLIFFKKGSKCREFLKKFI